MADPHKGGTCPDAGSPGFLKVHDDGDGLETISCRRDGSWVQQVKATGEAIEYSDYPTPDPAEEQLRLWGIQQRVQGNTGAAMVGDVAGLSQWIDDSYPDGLDDELVLRRRIGKLMNESGEVADALEGYTGENPRKGVFDTIEHVVEELLDVAVTALGAVEHITGNKGESERLLRRKISMVLDRVEIVRDSAKCYKCDNFQGQIRADSLTCWDGHQDLGEHDFSPTTHIWGEL